MDQKVKRLLENKGNNYIFPFFWQHGESQEVLREYMKVIRESNIRAVCVESRPHPDFLGEKWWKDMDIILDEARKRNTKTRTGSWKASTSWQKKKSLQSRKP